MWRENIHAQRLYKRRRYGHDGRVMSNWSVLNQSALDTNTVQPKPPKEKSSDNTSSDSSGTEYHWVPITGSNPNSDETIWDKI